MAAPSKMAAPSTPNNTSLLLALPAELRNQIYAHVLYVLYSLTYSRRHLYQQLQGCVWYVNGKFCAMPVNYSRRLLNIFLVCRQMHAEARLLPFSVNWFDDSVRDSIDRMVLTAEQKQAIGLEGYTEEAIEKYNKTAMEELERRAREMEKMIAQEEDRAEKERAEMEGSEDGSEAYE